MINNWIANEEIIHFYRFTNGSDQIWTYRCKERHDQTLKGRIDYVLGTPSLASATSVVKHIFHEYELTDQATSYFTIDFLRTEAGPGVFRAHPSLLRHYSYKSLIDNTIKFQLLSDISNKRGLFINKT